MGFGDIMGGVTSRWNLVCAFTCRSEIAGKGGRSGFFLLWVRVVGPLGMCLHREGHQGKKPLIITVFQAILNLKLKKRILLLIVC